VAGINDAVSAPLAATRPRLTLQATLGHGNISTTSGHLHARPDSSIGLRLNPEVFFDDDEAGDAANFPFRSLPLVLPNRTC
jgi:hypothetical protein